MAAIATLDSGTVVFEDLRSGSVSVTVDVCSSALTDGLHAFHIHESGDMSCGCKSMGPHYNPTHSNHGSLTSIERHAGDLGNVMARNGCVQTKLEMPDARVSDLVGRGVVFHEGPDDLGRGGTEESMQTGSAGARLLCAPILNH